jgi:hypothetical protein
MAEAAMSENPYAGFGKVIGGERMVGRGAACNELFTRLSTHSGSVAILGVPRIGKTSLIKEIYARLKQADAPASRVWIDLSTVSDSLTLFKTINDEFVAEVATEARRFTILSVSWPRPPSRTRMKPTVVSKGCYSLQRETASRPSFSLTSSIR